MVNRINNMRQYFYLVAHDIVGDDFVADKIFLQEHDALRWGKRLATKNPDYSVKLYKQEITRTGKLKFVKQLKAFLIPVNGKSESSGEKLYKEKWRK